MKVFWLSVIGGVLGGVAAASMSAYFVQNWEPGLIVSLGTLVIWFLFLVSIHKGLFD